MGDLPRPRVTPLRRFLHTGLDYAGPIMLRTMKRRSHKSYKAFIAVFVCLSTKAVYLDVIDSDIESDTSVFDVKSPTRENGRRSSTSTNNNNALPSDTTSTPGSSPKAVRSNSESQNTPEKKCVTTMSGNNIA
ncbi:br serine threonine-protein kinase 2 [Lasius niger]|uniref:Br serine threonine-protein kinase 2 n=1 Tax=Lasius niger TaxID=67767 RepID=A0A0J7NIK9_LASNI|nr:br serine threonine-protein kinase 2 [Lasius niger]